MAGKVAGIIGATISLALLSEKAEAYDFDTGIKDIQASWVSNVTAGIGVRTKNPSCALTGDTTAYDCGSAANVAQWVNGENGDLNYKKGHLFTAYTSTTSELFLTMPSEGLKFLIRGTAMYDFAANHTNRTALSADAAGQVVHSAQILDLWAEKDFSIGGQSAHVRVGNQVLNWGEAIYASGGVSQTNSVDIQKLLIPGTQLKQALLPAPMVSFASALPYGFSTEAYLQWDWNSNRIPPVGSYWSTSNVFGRGALGATVNTANYNIGGSGAANAYYNTVLPSNSPQFGLKLGYTPPGAAISFAAYYENYIDKNPVVSYLADGTSQFSYQKNRQLFGLSTNFSLGDWAIAGEFSYRPHDAESLSACYLDGGPLDANTNAASGINCSAYRNTKKLEYVVNAQLSLTPSSYPALKLIGADAAVFTAEFTYINYPGVNSNDKYSNTIDGQKVYQVADAGYITCLNNNSGLGYAIGAACGTGSSGGVTLDFNWTYDGTIIQGWQLTPGVTFSGTLFGRTPSYAYNYSAGAKSVNLYVLLTQNPATWQAGINYTMFFGGNADTQIYADRNFIGAFLTRNF